MYRISRDNRLNIEQEFLALIIHKPNILEITQIIPKYLSDEKNKIMLDNLINSYNEYGYLSEANLILIDNYDWEYFQFLENEILWHDTAWNTQLQNNEESIIKFYKEDLIIKLNEKLKNKKTNYDNYIKEIKKLDDIQIGTDLSKVTIERIKNSMEQKNKIELKNFPKLSNTLKLVQGDFLIIGATTGGGKSAFLINLMNDLMDRYQCIYFNLEMSEHTMFSRVLAVRCNMKLSDIEKPETEYQEHLIEKATKKILENEISVENNSNEIKQIRKIVAKKKNEKKHTILFLDHIGLTSAEGTRSLYEQSTAVAKALRKICIDYDCTIICASQLNRTAYEAERLTISMLKDSGEVENSASKAIIIQKQKTPKETITDIEIEIVKNREGWEGIIEMEYNKIKQIFKEKEK